MKFRLFIIITFFVSNALIFQQEIFAQQENVFLHPKKFYKKFFPTLKIKKDPPDSTYIKAYPNYLSVSVHLLSPSIRTGISPGSINAMGSSQFRTNIADIIGFSGSYRFITAGFAVLLKSGIQSNSDYAKSQYRTATIKYNSKAYSLEFQYLRFKGFTDVNSANNSDPAQVYLKRPDMMSKEFQFEGLYNYSWRKYSYTAPYTFSQRQIKSRVGFLLKAGVYYAQWSGDSALIAPNQQQHYDDFTDVKAIRTVSVKLAPGVGGNLVFLKRYYFSFAFFPAYDLYLYKYLTELDKKVSGRQTFAFVWESKASLGYQSKRLYAGLRYEVEGKHASLHSINTNNLYSYIGVDLGYRFNTPRLIKKVYKDTMPPGM